MKALLVAQQRVDRCNAMAADGGGKRCRCIFTTLTVSHRLEVVFELLPARLVAQIAHKHLAGAALACTSNLSSQQTSFFANAACHAQTDALDAHVVKLRAVDTQMPSVASMHQACRCPAAGGLAVPQMQLPPTSGGKHADALTSRRGLAVLPRV